MNEAWQTMLRSMEKRRDVDARFYKPVCLLAVIDGVSDGSIAPSDINLDQVCSRFAAYVGSLFPARADMGWRPFWHLSRDGAWIFRKGDKVVGPDDFRSQRKPNSRRELTAKSDHVAVPADLRMYWISAVDRAELREAVIAMMERDDAACIALAAELSGRKSSLMDVDLSDVETSTTSDPFSAGGTRQGFQSSVTARRAVELRAMGLASELLVSEGWEVEDVSAVRSFDLLARRGADVQHVEVKGTTGRGGEIQLTAAEVAFARSHRASMRLIVVSGIVVTFEDGGDVVASQGVIRSFEGWAPETDDLKPIAFFCTVPSGR